MWKELTCEVSWRNVSSLWCMGFEKAQEGLSLPDSKSETYEKGRVVMQDVSLPFSCWTLRDCIDFLFFIFFGVCMNKFDERNGQISIRLPLIPAAENPFKTWFCWVTLFWRIIGLSFWCFSTLLGCQFWGRCRQEGTLEILLKEMSFILEGQTWGVQCIPPDATWFGAALPVNDPMWLAGRIKSSMQESQTRRSASLICFLME